MGLIPFLSPISIVYQTRSDMNPAKLASLQAMSANVRIGGKGTARRKKKIVHKASNTDDKKLQSQLKKLSINPIPGIEEVNMFKDMAPSSTSQVQRSKLPHKPTPLPFLDKPKLSRFPKCSHLLLTNWAQKVSLH